VIQVGPTLTYPLDALRPEIAARYPWFTIQHEEPLLATNDSYDSHRKQYHSTRLLVALEKHAEGLQAGRLLGVTAFDLYVPGMNFVFGEARCPGRVAIISTYRLKVGSEGNPDLFHQRLVKEAIHEIGHTLGLRHCSDSSCVMYFSERLSDTDRKRAELCSACRMKMAGT